MSATRNALMIDIPTYEVVLPDLHKHLLKKRIHAQVKLWQNRVGMKMLKGGLPYSRGLLTLAACLEREGFTVKYLNHSDPDDKSRIDEYILEADYVCIYVMTPTVNIATSICDKVKLLNAKAVTILGGPHIDSRPLETMRDYPSVDFVMTGQAEHRLPALLNSIDQPEAVGGTGYRLVSGDIQMSSAPVESVYVAELPRPAYHLLTRPFHQYSHHIKTYRGCPYQCNFCLDRKMWNNAQASQHTFDQIIDELTFFAERLAPNTLVHFSDAIFNLHWEQRSQELVERIKAANLGLYFAFDTRVDMIKDEQQVKTLVDAGFIYFRMGFESIHNDVLLKSMKQSTREKEWEASRIIRSASDKAAIHAYILTGLPGTTRQSLAADVFSIYELVINNTVDTLGNKILVPYPGTPYGDNPGAFDIHILTTDWSKYDRRSYPVYRLSEVSADEIYFGYLQQEATLTQAYVEKLEGTSLHYKDVMQGLGYVYQHYVDAVW